jgi:fructokinase
MKPPGLHALGIDLGGTKVEARLFGPDGGEHWRHRVPTPAGDYTATVRLLAQLTAQAREAAGGAALTVGVGTPGTQAFNGRMKNCNSTCLNGQPLQADLQAAIGQAVRLANDANCLALSEATDGAGAGAHVVFAAILGTGTGAGIAVQGRVLTGPNGLAGEWGHNPLPFGEAGEDPAWRCYCGRTGCAESLLSGPGLAREHAQLHGGALDALAIARHATAGDADCAATLRRHTRRLARALAGVINLLDPDVIVLGGGLSALQPLYTDVPRLWSQWVFAAGSGEPLLTALKPALHGDASGVRGAAWLWKA